MSNLVAVALVVILNITSLVIVNDMKDNLYGANPRRHKYYI